MHVSIYAGIFVFVFVLIMCNVLVFVYRATIIFQQFLNQSTCWVYRYCAIYMKHHRQILLPCHSNPTKNEEFVLNYYPH